MTGKREHATPAVYEVPERGNLTDVIERHATEAPDAPLLRRPVGGGWQDVSCRAFRDEVVAVAKGLVASGLQPGERVGLMSRTRYEWTLFDFAIWYAGGVVVPIYETSAAEQVQWILSDSGAVRAVVETAAHRATLAAVEPDLPALADVWQIEDGALAYLVAAGRDVDDAEIDRRRRATAPSDIATIIYTSGTTGRPKGCVLTHANLMFTLGNVVPALDAVFRDEGACTLLFLPLAHVFARAIQIGCILARAPIGHSADVKNLLADLQSFRPTFILAVPRVFEKVYNSSAQKAAADGKGRIFDAAAGTAIAYSEALDRGGPSLPLRLRHALFDRLVYSKLRHALGGQVRWAISGGAPLGTRLGHFYRGIGLRVLEGYGLTETSAPATVNLPDDSRIGTVGKPYPGSMIRIADDGEILTRGGHVFAGYWRNDAATAEVMDPEGFLRTGDLGRLDDDGFLTITGRKKEILVTAGGKNVAPAVLEDRIRAHPLVSQVMVVGDQRPYIAALVTLDVDAVRAWLEAGGRPADTPVADLVDDPALRAEIQKAVDDANSSVSRAESIRRFAVLPGDWTEQGGQLTPKLSLKRAVVLKECAAEIEALYA